MSKETEAAKVMKRGMMHMHRTSDHQGGLPSTPLFEKRASASCTSGGFYTSPAAGASVDASSEFTITWDTSCLSASAVDIYLYAPALAVPRIHEWPNVPFSAGSYSANIQPSWWNNSASANLQLAIVEAGTPAFLATMPAGPIFTATHDPNTDKVEAHGGLAKGAVAAAVLVPIIAIALVVAGVFLRISRKRGQEDRKRWSEAVDRRMSTIAPDWSSITPSGASAAIRNSIAVGGPGSRASAFSFSAQVRPVSGFDAGQAGVGAQAADPYARPGVGLRPGAQAAMRERASRAVSFADQVRPSEEVRRSRVGVSRAYHTAEVPPLPTREDLGSGEVSPTQRTGAFNLSADDIRARLSGVSQGVRPSMDEYMPALNMMRQGGAGMTADDTILPPTPTHIQTPGTLERSPVLGLMSMQPLPEQALSPDAMLRQYAERRAQGAFSPPMSPVLGVGRALTPMSPATPATGLDAHQPLVRQSAVASEGSRYSIAVHGHGLPEDDEDAYGGRA